MLELCHGCCVLQTSAVFLVLYVGQQHVGHKISSLQIINLCCLLCMTVASRILVYFHCYPIVVSYWYFCISLFAYRILISYYWFRTASHVTLVNAMNCTFWKACSHNELLNIVVQFFPWQTVIIQLNGCNGRNGLLEFSGVRFHLIQDCPGGLYAQRYL